MRYGIAVFVSIIAWIAAFTTPSYAGDGGTVAILMPGGDGQGSPNDFLMRNRDRFTQAGIRTDVAKSPEDAVSLSKSEQARGARVILVGMSLGVGRAAQALAAGAQVSQAVFVSGVYRTVMSILGTPARLPPTLVVYNRYDQCPDTAPSQVEPFRQWAAGKVRVSSADVDRPNSPYDSRRGPLMARCGPFAAHGFYGQDGQAINAMIGFMH